VEVLLHQVFLQLDQVLKVVLQYFQQLQVQVVVLVEEVMLEEHQVVLVVLVVEGEELAVQQVDQEILRQLVRHKEMMEHQ
jgi:hypothetical protein